MNQKTVTWLFCDGACSGNPGPGGWGTVVLTPSDEVVELAGFEAQTTNNRMEMQAAAKGFEYALAHKIKDVLLLTDSSYVIKGLSQWVAGWRKKDWKRADGQPVMNRDLWEQLDALAQKLNVKYQLLPGHSGVAGNERADTLAVNESKKEAQTFFKGSLEDYGHDLRNLGSAPDAPAKKKKSSSSKKGGFYISLVSGKAEKHTVWAECERRVKGVSGARFKKVQTEAEAQETLRSWGFRG